MLDDYSGERIVIGPPGTGKSHFLARCTERIVRAAGYRPDKERSPVLACSLTRAAAAELGSRVELPSAAMRTIHSLAYRSMEDHPAVVDAEMIRDRWNKRHPAYAISTGPRCRIDLDDVFAPYLGEMPGDAAYAEYQLLRQRCVPRERWPENTLVFAKRWEKFKSDHGAIDFCDMLEFAADEPPLDPHVILLDEAQDCSRLAWRLIRRWAAYAGGLIAAGDPWQSLYDPWAGADASVLLDPTIGAQHRRVLQQSWRVPQVIQALALRWARHLSDFQPIEYFPRREDCRDRTSPFVPGRVVRCGATWREPYAAVQEAAELAAQGKSVLLIAATNDMTGPLCREMRARTLLFSNPWRRKERAWNPLDEETLAAVRALLDHGRRWTWQGLREWVRPLRAAGLLVRGAKAAIESSGRRRGPIGGDDQGRLFEREGLRVLLSIVASGDRTSLARWWGDRALPEHRAGAQYCVRAFGKYGADVEEVEPKLHPSTAHAAKGAEADHVFLFPDLSGAAHDAWVGSRKARDAVVRMMYVGITRARECLHICTPASWRSAPL